MSESDRKRRLMTRLPDPAGSREPNRPAAEFDAVKRRAPALAGQDWKGARQGAGGDDVAGCERRIDRIAREQGDEMTQCRQRAVEDIGAMAVIDHGAIAQIYTSATSRAATAAMWPSMSLMTTWKRGCGSF